MEARGAARVDQDMLLIVGPTDIRKKHAKKMKYLAAVCHASDKECGLGYWVGTLVGPRTALRRLFGWSPGSIRRKRRI